MKNLKIKTVLTFLLSCYLSTAFANVELAAIGTSTWLDWVYAHALLLAGGATVAAGIAAIIYLCTIYVC